MVVLAQIVARLRSGEYATVELEDLGPSRYVVRCSLPDHQARVDIFHGLMQQAVTISAGDSTIEFIVVAPPADASLQFTETV